MMDSIKCFLRLFPRCCCMACRSGHYVAVRVGEFDRSIDILNVFFSCGEIELIPPPSSVSNPVSSAPIPSCHATKHMAFANLWCWVITIIEGNAVAEARQR